MAKLGHHERKIATEQLHEIIFGLGHGLVSLVGLTTGLVAGGVSSSTIVFVGLVSLFTGAVTLFSEEYLAAKSQREVWSHWLEREREEFARQPDEEIEEMWRYYRDRGFTDTEIRMIVNRLTKNIDVWLEAHVVHILRFIPPKQELPLAEAVYLGAFHILGAIVPILPYMFLAAGKAVFISIILTLMTLFATGALRTKATGKNWLASGTEMLIIASLAATIGFTAGRLITIF